MMAVKIRLAHKIMMHDTHLLNNKIFFSNKSKIQN